MSSSTIFPAQPEQILKGLGKLWTSLGQEEKQQGKPTVLRACAMTLIVATDEPDGGERRFESRHARPTRLAAHDALARNRRLEREEHQDQQQREQRVHVKEREHGGVSAHFHKACEKYRGDEDSRRPSLDAVPHPLDRIGDDDPTGDTKE